MNHSLTYVNVLFEACVMKKVSHNEKAGSSAEHVHRRVAEVEKLICQRSQCVGWTGEVVRPHSADERVRGVQGAGETVRC